MTEPTKTLYRFKVMRGRHHEGGKTYYKGGPHGDIVTTHNDLRKKDRHGMPVKKFQLLEELKGPAAEAAQQATPAPTVTTPALPNDLEETLRSMTVEELRTHAEQEEIDLTGAGRKEEIINRILESATQPA